MYSGGWELVGKNKKEKNTKKIGKLNKIEKKKYIENAPNMEDFLPLRQVQTLYDNVEGNKENKHPCKEKEIKTKDNEEKKKQQKSKDERKKEEFVQKKKLPQSIKEAFNMINITEIQNLITSNQTNFPDAPLVWLKTIAAYLNSEISMEKDDLIFTGGANDYPLNIMPKSLRNILEKAVDTAGVSNVKIFYEFILTAIVTEMSKGSSVIGYKIFIQLLAKFDPQLSSSNIAKLCSIRNSYQNRKSIGLTLLWSFSQGGKEDFSVGLKVWHEVMAVMLESKSYSSYILQLLDDLLICHNKNSNLNLELYINIFEDFFPGKLNISNSVVEEGISKLKKMRLILFQNKNLNQKRIFETLLVKITPKTPQIFIDEIVEVLTSCLIHSDHCFVLWESLFLKNLYSSSILLSYLDSQCCTLDASFNFELLTDMLSVVIVSYKKSKKGKGKDDKYLNACKNLSQVLLKKMASKKLRKGSSFPWKTGIFFIAVLMSAIVGYDTHKHGSFEATNIGKLFRNSGITACLHNTAVLLKLYHSKSLELIEAFFPNIYKAIAHFSASYIHLANDLYLVIKSLIFKLHENVINYAAEKIPVIVVQMEKYIPGLLDVLQKNYLNALETLKLYSTWFAEETIENSVKAIKWLKTNLFVGKLSPESLQNYATQILNTTYSITCQTYDWVNKKLFTL